MKKIMKSRYFLPVLLVALLAVGGTLAYIMTQTQAVINTFKPTDVTVEITEEFQGTTKSNVQVLNKEGEDAIPVYIRVMLVHNWYRTVDGEEQLAGKSNWQIEAGNYAVDDEGTQVSIFNTTDWFKVGDYWYYKYEVPVGESTNELINKINLLQDVADGTHQGLEIVAEGIQSVPDEAVKDAWKAVKVMTDDDGNKYLAPTQ